MSRSEGPFSYFRNARKVARWAIVLAVALALGGAIFAFVSLRPEGSRGENLAAISATGSPGVGRHSSNGIPGRQPLPSSPASPPAVGVSAASPVPSETPAPTVRSERKSEGEWKTFARETLAAIPTVAELRKLSSAELHHTPEPVLRGATRLGEMSEYLHAHPEDLESGASFYAACAKREDAPDSLRALCAANLRNIALAVGKPALYDAADLSAGVKRLADHVPSGW